MRLPSIALCLAGAAVAYGQGVGGLDLNLLKQGMAGGQGQGGAAAALPGPSNLPSIRAAQPQEHQAFETQHLDADIRRMKDAEKGPARFAADLFAVRQEGPQTTDGGVSEDYVIGTGDQLYLNATGSASFDLAAQVDGRGEVVVPRLGSARVAGMSLGQAKAVIQRLVDRNYSRTAVDIHLVKLREVRVSVLGEVYKPGSYLVSSLASLVNVLSLTGGPTAVGSYRDIRVVRGGRVVYSLDLYPLRAEGLGNPNFALQSGDTVFVPLALDLVTVEGAFTRVVHQPEKVEKTVADADLLGIKPEDERRNALVREYNAILAQLDPVAAKRLLSSSQASTGAEANPAGVSPQVQQVEGEKRRPLEARLVYLSHQIQDLDDEKRGDHRLQIDPVTHQPRPRETDPSAPIWQRRWEETGIAPVMSFELKPGETLADLARFAGGLVPEAGIGPIAIRSRDASGRIAVTSVKAVAGDEAGTLVHRGDIVSAALAKVTSDQKVEIQGWARVLGVFARTEGLRVGDLLKQNQEVLPDTYLHRGEITRILPDGSTRFFSFDVEKAMAGEVSQNIELTDRDRVELYRTDDLRIQKTVTLLGPVTRPGVYAFHEGMRVADLIFQGGAPRLNADRYEAELAHTQDGKPSLVRKLDLSKLLSTEAGSPVALTDEGVNPQLLPYDQVSLFEKPGYKVHRTVLLQGQVAHPGSYVLDLEHETLSGLLERAGGLAPDAMPEAGIFLRKVGQGSGEPSILGFDGADPQSKGIDDILNRLNETKRNPLNGQILISPLLHSLEAGDLSRLVVDFGKALKGNSKADLELLDGDTVIIPRKTDVAYVVGEMASPFAAYKVGKGAVVRDLLRLAGGPTRNADTWNIRLLKADGRILDSWVMRRDVEPGDTVLVPQRIRRDTTWQENLQALTPIAILLNTLK